MKWLKLSPPITTAQSKLRLTNALNSGQWANGPRARAFEEKVASILDVDPSWVVATNSCTSALHAAGRLTGLITETVRVNPLTWPATYSWAMVLEWLDSAHATPSVSVDLWGKGCYPYGTHIHDAAHRFGDPAHALLARENIAVCYSFGPQKEIPCWEGGALVHPAAKTMIPFLSAGTLHRTYTEMGIKGLMSDAAAGFLLEQIRHWPDWRKKREEVLRWYRELLPAAAYLYTGPGDSSGHLCVIGVPSLKRDAVRAALTAGKIQWGYHYPMTLEQHDACPLTSETCGTLISLPCHVGMSFYDVRRVSNIVSRALLQ